MSERSREIEWPTLILIALCYLAWGLGTTALAALWLPLGFVVTVLAITLHSSLQHEVLHGHPFRSRMLNEALVFLPLGLCFPYGRFRDMHLAHHRDEHLTDPYDDPESNYLDPVVWARLPWAVQMLLRINNSLAGRMLFGPAISIAALLRGDYRALRDGDRAIMRDWALHVIGLMPVLWWIAEIAAMPVWLYLAAAYGGFSILKIRTFLEHRAHELARGRSVVVEGGAVLPFLFLNNNLHIVHHSKPNLAWYKLPALYAARREEYLRRNDGYRFSSYGEVFRRYFLRAKDPVPHPLRPQR
ncbi:MAG: fatty acid desaturase [Defluviimonas sp.]|uniref:fatty acid desaturase n=1 Tax=Albidovulum sp. TaxID=1872424 RepID=UPI001D592A22|nr:fatty acid desaturase [Paracoccaceae bacterium]MCC0063574.1 fatty acid desaturase [Defluviimonas sp.]